MPALARLQAKLGRQNLEVLAISIDKDGLAGVRRFYREFGLAELRLYLNTSPEAMHNLGVIGIPTTLLLDRKGRELGRLQGPAEWDSPEMIAFLRKQIGKDR